ncbi:transmembrane protein 132C [Micropterus dolomieu]|uniref:transmembrane protein 132C n=1 Tax=Micropterus dolomieu TaxID=147949 RepID=UPI001E8D6E1D|nr:transmembrane protein 132C [Micropterus dolomieu]
MLQGQDTVVSQLYAHMKAFRPSTSDFPALREVMDSLPQDHTGAQTRRYGAAIASLSAQFNGHFQDFATLKKDMGLFSSPYSMDLDDVPHQMQMELTELQCDELRGRHQQLSPVNFYRQLDKGRFPEMRTFAKKMLSLFGSTYLCEQTFSVMNLNKNRLRSRLTDPHQCDILHIATAALKPDLACVSPDCDQVLLNGKEMCGRQSLAINFTYLHLSAQLQLTVWVPKLPLQIDVSDTELSQVKGWRVPIITNKRPTRDSEDDEDDERKGKGCTLQYQHALVRVHTHFVAEPSDPGGEMVYMLGADWQADITHLVLDQLKVEDPQIARLIDGQILIGRERGHTTIQVLSPLYDSILAEKTVTVLDDKVTITDLGVQLIASLSLSMTASPGNYQAIQLTTTATDLLHTPKQEAVISAWIQYSDGSVTPLDVYDPKDFLLSAVSLDESVISVNNQEQHWPIVVAEGDGQGALVRVEMVISETCQKSKRKSVLASGVGNVMVKFGAKSEERGVMGRGGQNAGGGMDNSTSEHRTKDGGEWKSNSAALDREEGAMRKVSTTTKSTVTHRALGGKAANGGSSSSRGGGPSQAGDYNNYPAQVEIPGTGDSELTQTTRGLSDLEIGMYALLGVFCLAILVFLINCVSFAFRYRHKQVPVLEAGGNMNHAHDWVWLGNEADLLADHSDQCQGGLPDECTTIIDRNEGGYEENKYLLNGAGNTMVMGVGTGGHRGVTHGQTLPRSVPEPHQCLSAITSGGKTATGQVEHLNNSPRATAAAAVAAAKRKRVQFTSFATVLPNDNSGGGGPYTNSSVLVTNGSEDDIKWVCQDMDLGQSEIRTYMERLQDNL